MVRYWPGVTDMVPVTSPWYPPAGGRPEESLPPQLPWPPTAVMVSEVTSAGTVKFCRVSLSKPKVWVTVGVVAPAVGIRPESTGATRLPMNTKRLAASTARGLPTLALPPRHGGRWVDATDSVVKAP